MKLTRDAQVVVDTITELGGRALLVGGFVRDWFLGLPSKDIDIEVHGDVTPADLHLALSKLGRVDAVGISFGVLKFGRDVDVSFPRRDSKSGVGHTGFAIEFDSDMSVEEALARRDFTINSIAVDAVTREVIDPFGGQEDLKLGVIRATSDAFEDDPLRVLRAVQFAGRFGFKLDPELAARSIVVKSSFETLSKERLWGEWEKILTKAKSLQAVTDALKLTGWDQFFPDWTDAKFADLVLLRIKAQGVTGERRAAMTLAAMFSGRTELLRAFCRHIDAPTWLRRAAMKLAEAEPVGEHIGIEAKVRVIGRWLGQHVQLQDWLLVHWHGPGSPLWESAADQGILERPLIRLLRGEHLIARGFETGPVFGTIIALAQTEQDRKGWTTEAEAVAWLDENWRSE